MNKDVCKECFAKHGWKDWDYEDEKRWNEHEVWCPNNSIRYVEFRWKRHPPCLYELEQIVMSQNVKEKNLQKVHKRKPAIRMGEQTGNRLE